MYFPKSQIKPNLYTNGNEYILSTTRENYKGYYYELANGKKYTGKTPQDGLNQLIIPKPLPLSSNSDEGEGAYGLSSQNLPILSTTPYNQKPPNVRYLPQFNPTLPTDKDKSLGVFSRYFCKKTNELIYLEIDKQTYYSLNSRSSTIAWDLYIPLTTLWYIKGDKEKTYKANKGLISLIEQNQKWYGFSKYLKEDFLKYYSA